MNHAKLQGYLYIPCNTINPTHNPVCDALNAMAASPHCSRGLTTLLVNFDEDSAAGRRFTREERAGVAAVRRWLKRQSKETWTR